MKKLTLTLTLALLTGCSGIGNSLKPTVPDRQDARLACPTRSGTVLEVTDVTIEGEIGGSQALGALTGGYIGYELVSSSPWGAVAALVGALAGSKVGETAGKRFTRRPGQELVVLVEGESYSILQQTDERVDFAAGDDVWVIGNLINRGKVNTDCRNGIRVLRKT